MFVVRNEAQRSVNVRRFRYTEECPELITEEGQNVKVPLYGGMDGSAKSVIMSRFRSTEACIRKEISRLIYRNVDR